MKRASMLVLALALASCGGSHHPSSTATPSGANASPHTAAAGASTTSARSATAARSLSVTLSVPHSEPAAGRLWPITVSAHDTAGAPVTATVSYAFRFGGSVVARRPGGTMREGVFHDRLEFPARALGFPLTLEVIVKAAGQSGSVSRPVTVHS